MRLATSLALATTLLLTACARSVSDADFPTIEENDMSDLYTLSVDDGTDTPHALEAYRGKVALVVNVASECGYTGQYDGLQKLHDELSDQGFTVLAFPSNEFGGQEPGTLTEIRDFCNAQFGVTFPVFAKTEVKPGPGQSPLYAELTTRTGEVPGWNFCKYVIDRDGQVTHYANSAIAPDDESLRAAIDAALAADAD